MATANAVIADFVKLADRAYNNVYQSFKQVAFFERAELSPVIAGQAFVARKSEPPHVNSVEVKGALRIDKLPYRRKQTAGAARTKAPSRHAEGIAVLLESEDLYKFDGKPQLDNSFLYSSVVRMAYFQPAQGKWKPLLCVRYDFGKTHDAHPIFHAQLEDGVPSEETRNLFRELPVVGDPLQVHMDVRLPTANVVGATALVSLAADHLPLARFPDILRSVREQALFRDTWRCDCSSLDSNSAPRDMLASQWYSSKLRGV